MIEELREQIATIEVGGHQLQNFVGSVFIDKVVELIKDRDTKILDRLEQNTNDFYTMKAIETERAALKEVKK